MEYAQKALQFERKVDSLFQFMENHPEYLPEKSDGHLQWITIY